MRRLVKLAVIALGIRALWRWHRRRQERAGELAPAATVAVEDPADELRRKLAESREEEPRDAVTAPESTVEERRTQVHEQARAALDDMTSADEG